MSTAEHQLTYISHRLTFGAANGLTPGHWSCSLRELEKMSYFRSSIFKKNLMKGYERCEDIKAQGLVKMQVGVSNGFS